ncbi:hypothetical protein [Desulfosporosinus sp.]|uniref:hypothetical protein n=1 Tax=Desulfosporosinus sp. TaxID=157907 RepID=UPI002323EC73|nr:hypothetical protein [Desulfosporosinus sp.]MDA8222498.1 hypothetical protein [Desulfitobacterium hafniense]
MVIKKLGKVISIILLALLTFSLVSPSLIRADSVTYGYVELWYVDKSGNILADTLQYPIELTGGVGEASFWAVPMANYICNSGKLNGNSFSGNSQTITVTSSNTPANPVEIIFIYEDSVATKTVTVYGCTNDTNDFFSKEVKTYVAPKSIIIKAPLHPDPEQWVFDHSEPSGGQSVELSLTSSSPDNTNLYFVYVPAGIGVKGKFYITVGNHELTPDENGVVTQSNGLDNFGRSDAQYEDTVGTGLNLSISPPAQNPARPDLHFAFAIIERQSGSPVSALTNYVEKSDDNPISFNFTANTASWYVHFYWTKEIVVIPPEGGELSFTPLSTLWTNSGKISNGTGSYPVNVSYTGENPATAQGSVTFKHYQPRKDKPPIRTTHTLQFQVRYPLDTITITGDASATLPGIGGIVNITKQGANLALNGVGKWAPPDLSSKPGRPDSYDTESKVTIPPPPPDPTGIGGKYNLDWSNPTVSFNLPSGIVSKSSGAVRKPSQKGELDGYYGNITAKDNLSGIAEIRYGWSFGSSESGCNYTTIHSDSNPSGGSRNIVKEIEKAVGDNLYLHVRLKDIASNTSYTVFGPFEDVMQMQDLRVSDIKDPSYKGVFYDENGKHTSTFYHVPQLPIDDKSFWGNINVKKGYAFYFDFVTEYLYRLSDYVTVTPKFYYHDGTNRQQEVDVYYNLNNNPFVQIGGPQDTSIIHMRGKDDPKGTVGTLEIGGYSRLNLTDPVRLHRGQAYSGWKGKIQYTQGKEQYWYGKYFIPGNSIIVPKGLSPRPENVITEGYILVNFQITAYKNGLESLGTNQVFYYVPLQWTREGGPKNSSYAPGDIMMFNNMKSVLDDYGSRIIQ